MRELTGGMGLETSTPTGKLLFHILAAVAELERTMGVERTKAGLEAARRRGAVLGRPKAMVAGRARKAKKLLSQGLPVQEIAEAVGVHASTIYRWRKEVKMPRNTSGAFSSV
jgi:DNA invertase Pin-like site-specific DNA recombinase